MANKFSFDNVSSVLPPSLLEVERTLAPIINQIDSPSTQVQYIPGERANASPRARTRVLRTEFDADTLKGTIQTLVARWRNDSKFVSSMSELTSHPAHFAIVYLGRIQPLTVVPILLREASEHGDWWFDALRLITGENPVSVDDSGNWDAILQAWIEYLQQQGYPNAADRY